MARPGVLALLRRNILTLLTMHNEADHEHDREVQKSGYGNVGRSPLGGSRRARRQGGWTILLFGAYDRCVLPPKLRSANAPPRKRRVSCHDDRCAARWL